MDNLSPNKNSKQISSSSSGCSASSSTTDIKNSHKSQRLDNKPAGLRSRSFLHCLSKHLGRHFIHHHPHHHHTVHQNGQTIVYNSHEELRSSSTDSFSLSYERNSRLDGSMQHNTSQGTGTSSFDSSSEEHTSRASSSSAYSRFSPEQDDYENNAHKNFSSDNQQHHIYISNTIYRPTSSLDCHDAELEEDFCESDSGNSSSDENEERNQENIFNQNIVNNKSKSSPASVADTSNSNLATSSAKGLHLSRISITSSVKSILQHISSVSANSTRSLSCSSTPLKRVWDSKCKKSNSSPVNSGSSSNSNSNTTTNVKTNKSAARSSSNTSNFSSNSSSKKTEKKQQSILRPPMNYVYMKGMSGLYSRVPRYSVCCPYGTQQWA